MNWKISRRNFLTLGGISVLATGTGVGAARWESRSLRTTFKEITGLGLKTKIRVLHLSDFHASSQVPWSLIEESVEIGLSHKPELIFLTGDFVTNTHYDFEDYPKYFEALKDHPHCYAVMGNHDGKYNDPRNIVSMAARIEIKLNQVGVKLLHNRSVNLDIGGSQIKIAGLGDLWSREVEPDLCLGPLSENLIPTLLMAHNPDTKELLETYHWNVMFSGHTHGGQLVIPILNWRPILPVEDKSMVEGIYHWKNRWIHITRGVGNLHGLRINCPPEVSLIDLT